ncbi:hypothetical protein AYI68_g2025 [Smittium mucronatum]|uniref:Uncharacterized protein n=1 Tax=Smittium mucronatum TaxID=133383 RepID=A0A1R0H3R9_9FUNG|nr:hypothetical protein AYI68_g2025 [Smittium mucronatum]
MWSTSTMVSLIFLVLMRTFVLDIIHDHENFYYPIKTRRVLSLEPVNTSISSFSGKNERTLHEFSMFFQKNILWISGFFRATFVFHEFSV